MTIKGNYPASEKGNFSIIDTIGVPHPYCITSKHLQYSTGMYLDIPGAEEKGAVCDICLKNQRRNHIPILSYAEHEQALLVSCKVDIKDDGSPVPEELKTWLISIRDQATENGYVGFAFKRELGKWS